MLKKDSVMAFIGTYANLSEPGLFACRYDRTTGSLAKLDQISELKNPTYLDVDEQNRRIYTLAEGIDPYGQSCGLAVAYDIDPLNGTMTLLNSAITVPVSTCHITLDQNKQCLAVSSYGGGMIGVAPLLRDGRIGLNSDIQRHKGSSILPVQDRPRAHSTSFDRRNRHAVVCDLGLDQLVIYELDSSAYRLIPHGVTQVAPGSGPRHFTFHPTQAYGYVINELNSTITAFSYDEDQGELIAIQTISTLPDTYQEENACADIHVSPDGKFLYGSNRGHDSIVVCEIDSLTGLLTLVEYTSTLGKHPRNFAISPDGSHLLVANRDSDSIVTFNRDSITGKLTPTGDSLNVSKPVCIKFANF